MMRRSSFFTAAVILLWSILASVNNAAAQTQDAGAATSLIAGTALSGSTGRIAINATAGNGSAQTNIATVSTGDTLTSSGIRSEQHISISSPAPRTGAQSVIGADAFRGASGVISVNQSSGNGNTQANLAAIAAGNMSEISIEQLGRVSAAPQTAHQSGGDAGSTPLQKAVIADSAFAGARGIVQVNQLAGSGNSTANVFALSISAGIQ